MEFLGFVCVFWFYLGFLRDRVVVCGLDFFAKPFQFSFLSLSKVLKISYLQLLLFFFLKFHHLTIIVWDDCSACKYKPSIVSGLKYLQGRLLTPYDG